MPHTPWSSLSAAKRKKHNAARMARKRAARLVAAAERQFDVPRPMSLEEARAIFEQVRADRLRKEAEARG